MQEQVFGWRLRIWHLTVEFKVHLGGRLRGVPCRKEGCYYLFHVFKRNLNMCMYYFYFIIYFKIKLHVKTITE